MDREALLLDRIRTAYGFDLKAPGNEIALAAFEIENKRMNDQGLVMDFGSATGSESEHGMCEFYPGKYQFGSQRHIKTLVEKHMVQRVQESKPECELYARRNGLYNNIPRENTNRLDYVKGPMRHMESFDRDGNRVVVPVYGGGQGQNVGGSRYAALASADTDAPYVLGGGRTEEQSKFHNVPDPPRLRDGSIDYDRLNEMNGHGPMSGRRNVTIRRG